MREIKINVYILLALAGLSFLLMKMFSFDPKSSSCVPTHIEVDTSTIGAVDDLYLYVIDSFTPDEEIIDVEFSINDDDLRDIVLLDKMDIVKPTGIVSCNSCNAVAVKKKVKKKAIMKPISFHLVSMNLKRIRSVSRQN